jgi:hypothetical protein
MTFDYQPPRKDAPTVFPRFHLEPRHNAHRSEKEGRAVYDDVEYVEITVAGDTRTVVDERVKPEHKERWPQAYKAFKEGRELAEDGTPLEAWPLLTPGQVMEFKALNIRTVDALAALDDGNLNKLGTGGRNIREKAKAFLETAAGFAPASKALAEVEDLKAQMAVMSETIKALVADNDRLKSKIVEAA